MSAQTILLQGRTCMPSLSVESDDSEPESEEVSEWCRSNMLAGSRGGGGGTGGGGGGGGGGSGAGQTYLLYMRPVQVVVQLAAGRGGGASGGGQGRPWFRSRHTRGDRSDFTDICISRRLGR